MSSGKEFQRTDAATGNERRPTVDRRNGGCSQTVVCLSVCLSVLSECNVGTL